MATTVKELAELLSNWAEFNPNMPVILDPGNMEKILPASVFFDSSNEVPKIVVRKRQAISKNHIEFYYENSCFVDSKEDPLIADILPRLKSWGSLEQLTSSILSRTLLLNSGVRAAK